MQLNALLICIATREIIIYKSSSSSKHSYITLRYFDIIKVRINNYLME